MKRTLLVFSLITLIIFHHFNLCNANELNDILQTVAYLQKVTNSTIMGTQTTETNYGTGFFVKKNDLMYLITAAHVAEDMTGDGVTITIHGPSDTPLTYNLNEFSKNKKDVHWFFHPTADIALLLLEPSEKITAVYKYLDTRAGLGKLDSDISGKAAL